MNEEGDYVGEVKEWGMGSIELGIYVGCIDDNGVL